MKYKNIFFDMDGTLIDSGAALCRSFVKVMSEETGRPVRPEEYEPYWGVPGEEAFIGLGVTDKERVASGVQKWRRYFQEIQEWSPPFPETVELLETLTRHGVVLGVVTSKTRAELDANLSRSPLSEWLPHRVGADDAPRPKPAPDPLLEIMKRLGADKKDCLYVGDTAFDARCAAAAGVDFALACWGLLFGEPKDIQTIARLKRPLELLGTAQD